MSSFTNAVFVYTEKPSTVIAYGIPTLYQVQKLNLDGLSSKLKVT